MAQQNNRGRQQRIIIIFVLIALLLLIVGAFSILGGGEDNQKGAQPARPTGMVAVPVASTNIELGQRISSAMVTIKFMPPQAVPESVILRADYVVGRYATKPIPQATYFKEENISEPDVSGGYSAVAKPGKRIVVIGAEQLPGVIGTLRVGDHIDLLAIGYTDQSSAAASGQVSKDQQRIEYMLGGTQPGTPPRGRNRNNNTPTSGNATPGITATLISENAEVMRVPTRGKDKELVVLQMNPQDAHVTTLMVAAGASLRVVFRPSNENDRLTVDKEVKITTRLPKPEPDPERVSVIVGTSRSNVRPDSLRYAPAVQNPAYGQQDALKNPAFADTPTPPVIEIIRRDLQTNQYYE